MCRCAFVSPTSDPYLVRLWAVGVGSGPKNTTKSMTVDPDVRGADREQRARVLTPARALSAFRESCGSQDADTVSRQRSTKAALPTRIREH